MHLKIPIKQEQSYFSFRSVGVALPRYTIRSRRPVESDIFFAYARSAKELGIQVFEFDNKANLFFSSSLDIGVKKRITPELIVLDGNNPPGLGQISIELLQEIKSSDSYLLVDIPDCYATRDGGEIVRRWLGFADLVVIHNQRISLDSNMGRKILNWPGFPIPENLYYKPWSMKANSLSVLGYRHRQRELFVEGAIRSGIPLDRSLHSNQELNLVIDSYEDYISKLQDSRMHFANGYVSAGESIIVGRAVEALAASSTLLYEQGSDIDFYLEPYRDYVPILNIPDFIEKSFFLLAHDDYAKSIAESGKAQLEKTHGSPLFWEVVFKRLGIL